MKNFQKELEPPPMLLGNVGNKFDPIKIKEIQNAVFLMYPLKPGENQKLARKKCHIAIDESCHRLNRGTQ